MARSIILSALLLLASPLYAADLVINSFSGLNTTDNPATLAEGESQDLLNVNIEAGGKSVKKREGYGLYKNLPVNTSTTPVRGGYHFQDSNGNDIQLWGNDSKITAIVGGATPVVVATMTTGSTLQCTDSQGNAYCFTSSRDTRVITNGSTSGTSYSSTVASGTMAAFTPTRLVVAGISGSPNTLYFSRANAFNNFTIGTAEADAWTETIASPGSRITHIRYACGKLLWWKDQSFGWLISETQNDVTVNIIQGDIGTLDNSSAYYNNMVWFRGQDNHIYQYDCANLTRLSSSITPTVETAGRRKANSWSQSTQTEFATGGYISNGQSPSVSTASVQGSVTVTSISIQDTTNADFSSGVYEHDIDTSTVSGSITLKRYVDESFNSGLGVFSDSPLPSNNGTAQNDGSGRMSCDTINKSCSAVTQSMQISSNVVIKATIGKNADTGQANVYISSDTLGDSYGMQYENGGTDNIYLFREIKSNPFLPTNTILCQSNVTGLVNDVNTMSMVVYSTGSVSLLWNDVVKCSSNVPVALSTFTYVRIGLFSSNLASNNYIDNVVVSARTGSFQSRVFDTLLSTPIYGQFMEGSGGLSSSSTIRYGYKCSTASSGGYTSYASITSGTNITGCGHKRYFVYISSLTSNSIDRIVVSSVSIVAASTGTYYSSVYNAASLTSWDIFTANESLGDGTITYYTRSSTGSFTVLSSTPGWIAQSKNAQVASSTGTYFQARADFAITAATQTPTLNDFTFNWYEGSAGDKAYIEYFDDHVWVAVASGASTSNNRIQRWDTVNNTWLLDDIPAGGLVVDQNRLYLGDPANGRVFRFGDVHTDNSSSFESYWKSKDYVGGDPFVQNEWVQHDWLIDVSTGSLTVSYQVDTSTITSYALNLYDPTAGILHRSRNLPPGKLGTFYNVRIGNTSDQPWEVFGHRVKYTPLPWRPN